MIIMQVMLRVKPDQIDAFKKATQEIVEASLKEPGCIRFEVYQQEDIENKFLFWQIFTDEKAADTHLASVHAKKWSEATKALITGTGTGSQFKAVFPAEKTFTKK